MIRILYTDITGLTAQDYQRLYDESSPERKAKADRYLRQEDKVRCVVADALLRHAIAQTLPLADYRIHTDENGKPHLEGVEGFHFNLSHAGSYVAIAYGDAPVGLDVEQYRTDADIDALSKRFYTPDEQRSLDQTPPDQHRERFFQIWTAKESILKYWGTGLRRSLDSFSTLTAQQTLGIHLHHIPLDGHCMTLCTTDPDYTLHHLPTLQRT